MILLDAFGHDLSFCIPFCDIRLFLICSMSAGCEGCPCLSSVQLCKISLAEGKLGPIGVDLMHRSILSKVFPEASAVVSAVFIVLTWHSMYPFDFG